MRIIDADLLKRNCKITGEFKNNFQGVDLATLGEVIDKQPTICEWRSVKDDPPPDYIEVLFKYFNKFEISGDKKEKIIKRFVGMKTTTVYGDCSKEFQYYCVTTKGIKSIDIIPDEWMPLLD